ncbi:MAG: cytochrome c [Thermodesulfovibrionales bacterium]
MHRLPPCGGGGRHSGSGARPGGLAEQGEGVADRADQEPESAQSLHDHAFVRAPARKPGACDGFVSDGNGRGGPCTGHGRSCCAERRCSPFPQGRAAALRGAPGAAGIAAGIVGSAERGAVLFRDFCVSCHGPEGRSPAPNPGSLPGTVPPLKPIGNERYSADPKTFARNIDRVIQNGSVPAGANPSLSMPAFGATHTLTQQEIANIEAYVLRLNGVDRAQLLRPGLRPVPFFFLAASLYVLFILVQGGLRIKNKIPDA